MKKLFACILVIVMIASLAACGKKEDTPSFSPIPIFLGRQSLRLTPPGTTKLSSPGEKPFPPPEFLFRGVKVSITWSITSEWINLSFFISNRHWKYHSDVIDEEINSEKPIICFAALFHPWEASERPSFSGPCLSRAYPSWLFLIFLKLRQRLNKICR